MTLVVNSNLGDGGFFDQAHRGFTETAEALELCEQTIETGPQPTKWAPALNDAAAGPYDVVFAGTFQMKEVLEQAAMQHPDKEFVLFDVAHDADACGGCRNIYSLTLRYRESGFLAGVVAALVTSSETPRANPEKVVGFVGGQEIPVIREYHDGFVAGAKAADPEVRVISAYAGSFTDPVKGKQLAAAMVGRGVDVLFTAAGATDKGVFEAAAENDAWAIGNSPAQARDQPDVAGKPAVLTAASSDLEKPIALAVRNAAAGTLALGTVGSYGIKEGAIEIFDSPTYERTVPADVRKRAAEYQTRIADGELDVDG